VSGARRRRTTLALVAAAALLAVACGEGGDGGAPGGAGGPPAMPVDVAVAIRDSVREELIATGQIEAEQAIELRPEVDGRIIRIMVPEGSEVGAGQGLFKIDDAELRAQVWRLEAERDLAEQALARTRRLLEENAASEAELEEAEARARSAQANLELQQVRLERTLVRAPFSGVLGQRRVSLGDYVTSSTPLVSLQTVDPQRAAFDVPERYAARLAVGQEVVFEVAAVPDREFIGTVDFVDPRVELPGRTIRVKAEVPNRERLLQAGMFIEARLSTELRPDAVLVPETAVVQLESGPIVWVVGTGGQAFRREVELGIRRPGWVEIRTGVEAGETVITAGMERLFEGAVVMPRQPIDTPADASGAPAPEEDVGPPPDSTGGGSDQPSIG